jgi:hypothetical protein
LARSVVARRVGEGGRRRENALCGGTDAERVVLLLVEWQEQEGEKQHKRKRDHLRSLVVCQAVGGRLHPHSCEPPTRVHRARVPSAFVARETALAPAWYRQQEGGSPPGRRSPR